jgi:hypothetical protein
MPVGDQKALVGQVVAFVRRLGAGLGAPDGHTDQPLHHPRRPPAHVRRPFGPFQKQHPGRRVDAHGLARPAPGGADRQHVKGGGAHAVHFGLRPGDDERGFSARSHSLYACSFVLFVHKG